MNHWRKFSASLILMLVVTACASTPQTPQNAAITAVATKTLATPTIDSTLTKRESLVYTGIIGMGIKDEAVIEAVRNVPRHLFVPEEFQDQAYANHPLPIGYGQTISQPYIVALMTEAAEVSPGDKVLEVGTGSGYQAAVLAEIVDHVYSIEIIGELAERSKADLEEAGYDNVTIRHADGYFGWEDFAPYDAILVTAAPDHVPQPLIKQLKIGGHLIIPVGPVGGFQTLWRITRISKNEVQSSNLGGVRFVPLTREERQQ